MAKQELAEVNANAVSQVTPDYLSGYQGPSGTDNIDSTDVNIPRLKLAQGLTPEVKEKIVEDGDFFHSITKERIIKVGDRGLVVPIAYTKEFILWNDINAGGGIFARAKRVVLADGSIKYAWDKPGQTFETKVKGIVPVKWTTAQYIEEDGLGQFGSSMKDDKESQPAATAHYNYIVALPEYGYEILAVSLSRTATKTAKDWNAMLKMGSAPMFARVFSLFSKPDQNDQGQQYFNYGIVPAGFVSEQAIFEQLKKLNAELGAKGINVDWSDEESRSAGADESEKF